LGAATEGDVYDITVVGGGPTGLFATFYAGLRQMRTKLIDALEELGGQVAVLYPEKEILDVGGFPTVLGRELVRGMVEQATKFNPSVILGERIVSIRQSGDGLIVLGSASGREHYSKTVLLCAGVGAFAPNKLEAPSAAQYEGRGVYYFLRDKALMKEKRVLIVGGGDSAVDWALNLFKWAKSVTLIHRRDVFRAHEGSVSELMNRGVDVRVFHEIKDVVGDGKSLTGAIIYDNRTREETALEIDAVLVNIGFRADSGATKAWGLKTSGREVHASGRMETSMPGVFVAGDIASPIGGVKLNLIATGFAQAAVAVNVAKNQVDPKSRITPIHSTEMRTHPQ